MAVVCLTMLSVLCGLIRLDPTAKGEVDGADDDDDDAVPDLVENFEDVSKEVSSRWRTEERVRGECAAGGG